MCWIWQLLQFCCMTFTCCIVILVLEKRNLGIFYKEKQLKIIWLKQCIIKNVKTKVWWIVWTFFTTSMHIKSRTSEASRRNSKEMLIFQKDDFSISKAMKKSLPNLNDQKKWTEKSLVGLLSTFPSSWTWQFLTIFHKTEARDRTD